MVFKAEFCYKMMITIVQPTLQAVDSQPEPMGRQIKEVSPQGSKSTVPF